MLLAAGYLLTRGPVVAVIKGVFWLALKLIWPAVYVFGLVKAWGVVDQKLAKKAGREVEEAKPVAHPPRKKAA